MNTTKMLAVLLCVAAPLVAWADTGHDLRVAARAGDLATVKALVESGVAVDAADTWGTTALMLAAKQGETKVVGFLLSKGADPDARESFFGMSVMDNALWTGEPEFAVAKQLLAAGSLDRDAPLSTALERGDVALARAAVASGPLTESEAAAIRETHGKVEGELAEVLAAMTTRPDPPPPAYGPADLARFAGTYHANDGAFVATVDAREGGLTVTLGTTSYPVVVIAENEFRDPEAGVTVRFRGRAGTIERMSVERDGHAPMSFGPADGVEAAAIDPSELSLEEPAKVEKRVHWPGFRGRDRDGIGDGADPPVDFDLESGKGVLWRAALPGLGNSSPVVWGDRVYVTTAVAEGGSVPLRTGLTGAGDEIEEDVEHRWLVLAFDKKTGKKVWETEVGRGVPLTRRHFKATQANSTPYVDGKHVVVVFPTAGLACLGMDGAIHWKQELGGLNAGGFNDPGMQWGFASSPIVHDGRVILQVDIHDGPYLAAWALDDGKPLWTTERPGIAPSWSTPVVWPTPEGEQLVVNASEIHGYDPESGKRLWTLGPTSIQVVAAPILAGANVLVSSGYPPARPIYMVKPGIEGEHVVDFAADALDGALAWAQPRGGAYMPTPLLYRGLLYMIHHNGRLTVHDVRTGRPVYKARFSAGGTLTSSPVAANGIIYQGSEEGTLYVLEAGTEHVELAVHDFGAPLMATPAISEGILLVRTPTELIALKK